MEEEGNHLVRKAGQYLVDLRHHENGHECCQETKGAGDPEGILALADGVGGVLLNNGDHVGAHEGSDLAECGGVGVVLTTDGSCAGLGGTQTDVVAGSHLTEGREDTVPVSVWGVSSERYRFNLTRIQLQSLQRSLASRATCNILP